MGKKKKRNKSSKAPRRSCQLLFITSPKFSHPESHHALPAHGPPGWLHASPRAWLRMVSGGQLLYLSQHSKVPLTAKA